MSEPKPILYGVLRTDRTERGSSSLPYRETVRDSHHDIQSRLVSHYPNSDGGITVVTTLDLRRDVLVTLESTDRPGEVLDAWFYPPVTEEGEEGQWCLLSRQEIYILLLLLADHAQQESRIYQRLIALYNQFPPEERASDG